MKNHTKHNKVSMSNKILLYFHMFCLQRRPVDSDVLSFIIPDKLPGVITKHNLELSTN